MTHHHSQSNNHPSHLLNSVYLLRKSHAAYQHAKITVEEGSPISDEICKLAVKICTDCVQTLKDMDVNEKDARFILCHLNLKLCKDLYLVSSS
ncbi:hypothetical protein LCL89_04975 [Halobacillus yeomjeoni]|uniref:Uncharacterized protein n=1 Tax=Halobacillus yeomjeoni TaxID=311194 RepID=A0A931MTU3_9BACI|nr:hypothetical protein [Halobacillus yeomjeoni]MBH0229198.1 hypothetical protein [Halobacillus yeomjeoni]MCA0983403.1 hypothetical protein [Halobacillus yeomjeoni]